MLVFLKENSYSITKMIINQIGMTVFGTVLAFATNSNATLFLLASLFSIVFYLSLLYSMTWEIGAKDKIRVESGRMPNKPLLGMYISLSANIPNIIIVLLMFIGFIFGSKAVGIEMEWAGSLYLVMNTLIRLLLGMYTGTINYFLPKYTVLSEDQTFQGVVLGSVQNPTFFLLAILPSVIVCAVSYYFGLKGFRLSSLFRLKTTK